MYIKRLESIEDLPDHIRQEVLDMMVKFNEIIIKNNGCSEIVMLNAVNLFCANIIAHSIDGLEEEQIRDEASIWAINLIKNIEYLSGVEIPKNNTDL